MLFSLSYTTLLAAFTYTTIAQAAPAPVAAPRSNLNRLAVRDVNGTVVPGEYIVKLKKSANRSAHIEGLPFAFSVMDAISPIFQEFAEDFFDGYAGNFTAADLDAILASPDVEYVEPNVIFSIADQQTDATWGLQSISTQTAVGGTDSKATNYKYTFEEPAGEGVDIYIVDTGIYTDHTEFEGRATFGYAGAGMQMADGHGHGTHCAGTAAGKTFGVSKKSNLIAVKVLNDSGSGTSTDIIAGIQWMVQTVQSQNPRRPSIASLSLGGGGSTALDSAVQSAIDAGIVFTVAAGNSNQDCSGSSPARVPAALTVAASDIQNVKASFSNFGAPVDIWAPGVDITSAWIGSNTATNTISGTSMSTPHIAGLAAYLLSKDTSMNPAAVSDKIKSLGTPNVISGAPNGTVNLLAYNGGGSADSTNGAPASVSSPLPNFSNLLTSITSSASSAASTASSSISSPLANFLESASHGLPAAATGAPSTGDDGSSSSGGSQTPEVKAKCPAGWSWLTCAWNQVFN